MFKGSSKLNPCCLQKVQRKLTKYVGRRLSRQLEVEHFTPRIYSVAQKEHIFSNNCNFFNIKNYVNTKISCNKCSFDYLH